VRYFTTFCQRVRLMSNETIAHNEEECERKRSWPTSRQYLVLPQAPQALFRRKGRPALAGICTGYVTDSSITVRLRAHTQVGTHSDRSNRSSSIVHGRNTLSRGMPLQYRRCTPASNMCIFRISFFAIFHRVYATIVSYCT
jgi:hypothetical protein